MSPVRRAMALAVAIIMALSLHTGAAAQSPPVVQMCVTVAGDAPAGGWTIEALAEAFERGVADVVLVADPSVCPGVVTMRADAEESADLAPIRIVGSGVTASGDGNGTWAVTLENVNPSPWAAVFMPVLVRLLDESGNELESLSVNATVLPGQTTSITGQTSAARAVSVEAEAQPGPNSWRRTDSPDELVSVTDVKTRKGDFTGVVTSGCAHNLTDEQLRNVMIIAVYLDDVGEIIGGGLTFVPFLLPGGDAPFEIIHFGPLKKKDIAQTVVHYQVFLLP